MFWYIERNEERPWWLAKRVATLYVTDKIKTLTKEERLELAKQAQQWEQAMGKNFYRPNKRAWRWFLEPHFIKWIFGGNRSGKTATCVLDDIMQCEGWHPLQKENLEVLVDKALDDWVKRQAEEVLKRRQWIKSPPVEGRIVAVDFPNGVEKFVGPEVRKWATKSEIEYDGISNEKRRKIVFKNGSYIEFMSHDQDLDAHGGTARDFIHFDEEPPSDIYQENLMRVINGGRLTGGMTAVKGITWVKDQIWDRYEKGDKQIYAVKMWTEENPILTKRGIQAVKDQCLDDDEIEIRLHGEFKARGGLVWKEYRDRHPWVIKPFEIPDKGKIIMAIDPHAATEHAVLWAWVDYDGLKHELKDGPNIYLIDELFQGGTIPELANSIKMMEARLGRKHDIALCDPSAWTGTQTDDNTRTVYQQFADEGIYPIKGSKDLTGGIHKVRSMYLCSEEADDHPRLMVFSDLTRTRWENGKYRYPEWRGRTKDEKAPRERPVDKDDHMMECKRRIVEFVWDWTPEEEKPEFEITVDMIDPLPKVYDPQGKEVIIDFEEEVYDPRLGEEVCL